MKFTKFNKTAIPVYLHIIFVIIYFILIPNIEPGKLSQFLMYFMLIGLPVIFFTWLHIGFMKIFKKEIHYFLTFLLSFIIGFIPSAILGWAYWGSHFYSSTFYGFVKATMEMGLPMGIKFGVAGLFIHLIFTKLKSS